jgi:hypothetical protein
MLLRASFLLCVLFSFQAKASDPSKLQDIRRYFVLTNAAETIFADIKNAAELQRRGNPQITDEFWKELFSELKPGEIVERLVPIYDKNFSHDEIKAWNQFFESPAGQVFIKKQPEVINEGNIVGQAYVQEVGGPILRRLRLR